MTAKSFLPSLSEPVRRPLRLVSVLLPLAAVAILFFTGARSYWQWLGLALVGLGFLGQAVFAKRTAPSWAARLDLMVGLAVLGVILVGLLIMAGLDLHYGASASSH